MGARVARNPVGTHRQPTGRWWASVSEEKCLERWCIKFHVLATCIYIVSRNKKQREKWITRTQVQHCRP